MRTQSSKLIWMVNTSSFCLQVYKKWIKENSCLIFDPVSQHNATQREAIKQTTFICSPQSPPTRVTRNFFVKWIPNGSQDDCWNRGFRVSIQTCPANSLKIMERGLYKNLGTNHYSVALALYNNRRASHSIFVPIAHSFLTASLYILPPSNCSKTTSLPIRRVRFLNLPTNEKSDYYR
jgi:hypothetical protein